MKKINKWLCRKFGHKFDLVDLTMLDIMQNGAINKTDFADKSINCKRCGVPCSYNKNVVNLYENPDEMDLV